MHDPKFWDKYETIAQDIGIDTLKAMVPAKKTEIVKALSDGDEYLNSIPLQKWDAAAGYYGQGANIQMSWHQLFKGMSLAERVCTLKHVARTHVTA